MEAKKSWYRKISVLNEKGQVKLLGLNIDLTN
jgi:hypothetical protein